MKKIIYISLFSLFAIFSACETTELDLTVNPDELSPGNADLGQVFSATQIGLANFFEESGIYTMDLTRMTAMTTANVYSSAYRPDDFNTIWSTAYATFLADVVVLKQIAEENENTNMLAVAQTMEAYVLMTLADLFGDIPYTQALQGGENLSPESDSAESIYDVARNLLLSAKTNYDSEGLPIVSDLFYNNNEGNWEKLTNSLLLKLALNSRLANESQSRSDIQSLINADNFISTANQDFEFKWGTNVSSPASRHPKFSDAYDAATPTGFQSNSYMWLLQNDKTVVDPRIRYYFYRKTLTTPTSTTQVACIGQDPFAHYTLVDVEYPFCTGGNGYVGRDHGNNGSVLGDGAVRTIYGIYPVGGQFDDDSATGNPGLNAGAGGAGVSPIMTSSFVEFMLAEAQLTLFGNTGSAKTNLENGIRKSIQDVTSTFSSSLINSDFTPTSAEIDSYVSEVLQNFDADSDKLNIVMKEYYFALFGNGIETYNNYRRTGRPNNLQPSINATPGSFFNLLWYPANHVSFNNNATQRTDISEKPFWAENTTFNLNF